MAKKWNQVSAGDLIGATQRLWVAVGDKADEVVARINTDAVFVADLGRFIAQGGFKPSTPVAVAHEIMGRNYFGPAEARRYLGVKTTKPQLATLVNVPWSEETLTKCKDTHVLVAVFPLSILYLRNIFHYLFYLEQDWYCKQLFAKVKNEARWHLVRKAPILHSEGRPWSEQQELLSQYEEVPNARVLIYTMAGHFLATNERLFKEAYVRCSDVGPTGFPAFVGSFDSGGLHLNYTDDCDGYVSVGVASEMK